jgi:hypothetical protein
MSSMPGAGRPCLLLACLALAGCAEPSPSRVSQPASEMSVGLDLDRLVGRIVRDAKVVWLTERSQLVTVEPFTGATTVVAIDGLLPGEHPWGLAALDGGEDYFTLLSPRILGRVGFDGRVAARLPLRTPRLVVYGWRRDLLLMDPHAPPGEPVLVRVSPLAPDDAPVPFGSLLAREFARPRADVWLLNYPICGVGRGDHLPCWFRDEAVLGLAGVDGPGHRVELQGLRSLPAAVLDGPMEAMPRVIRDVHAATDGSLWVLSDDVDATSDDPGATRLTRHARDGALMASTSLERAARMLLAVRGEQVWLLVGSGIETMTLP